MMGACPLIRTNAAGGIEAPRPELPFRAPCAAVVDLSGRDHCSRLTAPPDPVVGRKSCYRRLRLRARRRQR